MSTWTDRINEVVEESQLNDAAFGREIGVSRSTVNQWRAGQTKATPENVFKIADRFHWAARWLATGDGPKREHRRNDNEMRRLWERYNAAAPRIRVAIDALLGKPAAEKVSGNDE